jgi:hypothetical protein
MTDTRVVRRTARLLAVGALALVGFACSGDTNDDTAARNSSNFNTRSIVAFGSEVPTMPDAQRITRGTVKAGAWHKTYVVPAAGADVLAFYQRELPSAGWTSGGTPSTTPGGFEATWRRPGLRLDVTVAPSTTPDPSTTAAGDTSSNTVNLTLDRTGRQ